MNNDVFSLNELVLLRLFYDKSIDNQFIALSIDEIHSILTQTGNSLCVPTVRRIINKLLSNGYLLLGVKKRIKTRSFYISDKGKDVIDEMIRISQTMQEVNINE